MDCKLTLRSRGNNPVGACTWFYRPTAKVPFEPVLIWSDLLQAVRELVVWLWPEIYMPCGLVALLWQELFLVAHMRTLLLKFCLFPMRTYFGSLSLTFSVSKCSTRFHSYNQLAAAHLEITTFPKLSSLVLFSAYLWGAALSKEQCACFEEEIHEIYTSDSFLLPFLVVSDMKPGLLQIKPGTCLFIACSWLRHV